MLKWPYHYAWFLFAMTSIWSCKHGKCESGPLSTAQGRSHNAGENCMRCHLPDGEGEICWTVAGTIYDHGGQQPVAGAEIGLFTAPLGSGELRVSLPSDATGNIHTSENVSFGSGLFPAVITGGDTAFMLEPITDGACNRCHGRTTDRMMIP